MTTAAAPTAASTAGRAGRAEAGNAPRPAHHATRGTARPTGPLVSVASPMASPASGSQSRSPPARRARSRQKSAAVTRAVNGMSKIASLPKAMTSGVDATISPARSAWRRPGKRSRPMANVSAMVASAPTAAGRRAASSPVPSTRKTAAISQKNSAGLSRYGRPLKCGTLQRPSASISRATSALRASSGSRSGQRPSPQRKGSATAITSTAGASRRPRRVRASTWESSLAIGTSRPRVVYFESPAVRGRWLTGCCTTRSPAR